MAAAETAFGGVVANTFVACEIIQSSDRVTAAADQLPGAILGQLVGLGRERLALFARTAINHRKWWRNSTPGDVLTSTFASIQAAPFAGPDSR